MNHKTPVAATLPALADALGTGRIAPQKYAGVRRNLDMDPERCTRVRKPVGLVDGFDSRAGKCR